MRTKVSAADRMLHQAGGHGKGHLRIKIHAHLGKLHAYVGIQLALFDGVEQAVIDLGRLLRLLGRTNVFSQAIERGRDPLAVHGRGRVEHLLDAGTGHKAGGHPPPEAGIFHEVAQGGILGERN